MNAKEISRRADRLFLAVVPSNWCTRSQQDQEDYGIDYELEVLTNADQATGLIFKVQLKGSRTLSIRAGGTRWAFSDLKVARVKYWAEQVALPVVFVAVDIERRLIVWKVVPGDAGIQEGVRRAEEQGYKTMTISGDLVECTLPGSEDKLLKEVVEAQAFMAVRAFAALDGSNLRKALEMGKGFDPDIASSLRSNTDHARLNDLSHLVELGEFDDAVSNAWPILESESESFRLRFAAGIHIGRTLGAVEIAPGMSYSSHAHLAIRSRVMKTLLPMVRSGNCPHDVRLGVLLMCRLDLFNLGLEEATGLMQSAAAQRSQPGGSSLFHTLMFQSEVAVRNAGHVTRLTRLIVKCLGLGYRRLLYLWARDVGSALCRYIQVLRTTDPGGVEGLAGIRRWLWQYLDICMEIAASEPDEEGVVVCAELYSLSAFGSDEAVRKSAFSKVEASLAVLASATLRWQTLQWCRDTLWPADRERSDVSLEEEVRVIALMAGRLGIDLSDSRDPIASIVRVGLKDLDPTRVLRRCKHLYVKLNGPGIPGQMLGLPTAGSKRLGCDVKRLEIGNQSLDRAYETLKRSHCDNCSVGSPMPPDWRWSREWQRDRLSFLQKLFAGG